MKKYQQNKLIIFLFFVFFSCSEKESTNNKIINSKLLFSSTSKKNEILEGANYYFDKNENLLTDILFLQNNDSVLHYQMTVRNSKKQIVYFCEYKNGIILKEFDFFKFEEINIENGAFLYKNYCLYCHSNTRDIIGKSKFKMSKLSSKKLLDGIYAQREHDSLAKLTKNQILSVISYIKK